MPRLLLSSKIDAILFDGINCAGGAARRADDERLSAGEASQLGVTADGMRLRTDHRD